MSMAQVFMLQEQLGDGMIIYYDLYKKYHELLEKCESQEFMIRTLIKEPMDIIEPTELW